MNRLLAAILAACVALPVAAFAADPASSPSPSPTPESTPVATPITAPQTAASGLVVTGVSKLKLGGTMFLSYKYDLEHNQGNKNAFDVDRAYVNVEPFVGDHIFGRITTDLVRQAATTGTNGQSTNTTGSDVMRLKYAYIGYSFGPDFDARAGLQHTLWTPWVEDIYGYRLLGKQLEDEFYGMSTSDFGWTANARLCDNRYEISAGVFNGESFTTPEANKFKEGSIRAVATVVSPADMGALRVAAYYSYGIKANPDAEKVRGVGLLYWQDKHGVVGAQYLYARDSTTTAASITGGGPSIFGRHTIPFHSTRTLLHYIDGFQLVGRLDMIDPDTRIRKNEATRFIVGGGVRFNERAQTIVDFQQTDFEDPTKLDQKALFVHWELRF